MFIMLEFSLKHLINADYYLLFAYPILIWGRGVRGEGRSRHSKVRLKRAFMHSCYTYLRCLLYAPKQLPNMIPYTILTLLTYLWDTFIRNALKASKSSQMLSNASNNFQMLPKTYTHKRINKITTHGHAKQKIHKRIHTKKNISTQTHTHTHTHTQTRKLTHYTQKDTNPQPHKSKHTNV